MQLTDSTRRLLAGACFALGATWAAAGTFKLVFGIRVTFPLLPPVDLDRVDAVPAIGIALGLMALGAWLGRVRQPEEATRATGTQHQPPEALGAAPFVVPGAVDRMSRDLDHVRGTKEEGSWSLRRSR